MKNILKSKSGMTLVEVMVALLISSILIAAIGGMVVPVLKVFARSNEMAEINGIMNNVIDEIGNDIICSRALPEISSNKDSITCYRNGNVVIYTVKNGMLMRAEGTGTETMEDPIEVFPKKYYKGKVLAIEFGVNTAIYEINLTITDKNDNTYTRISKAKPMIAN